MMEKEVHQMFKLDMEKVELKRKEEREKAKRNPKSFFYPDPLTYAKFLTIWRGLEKKGYNRVIVSQEMQNGVPMSILVSAPIGRDIKFDFYKIANEVNLPFISGDVFFEIEE